MAIQKVTRQSLKDQIKTILIDRIIEGALAPGDRIKEMQIARELGTSQAPVREAIRCLETLGYIEHIPHVGALVKTVNRREMEEAYQVREALEIYAVSQARPEPHQLVGELDNYLEQMRRAVTVRDVQLFTRADNSFHRALVAFSGNETMLTMWDSLKMQLQVVGTLVEAAMPLKEVFVLHPPIVAALKKGSHAAAADLMTSHYQVIGSYWRDSKTSK